MNDAELAARLERIESHLAHLEKHCEELNEVVIEQNATIKKLQTNLQRLAESTEASELERIRATNPKPPHYQ